MARKQTLKSLLGGSDEREQVELNLGTPALQPTAQRAGQYRVAVAPTPKTNSALQLAQALRRAPQVLGQANNIAKGLGEEAAAQVVDVEAAMADPETKGILGYDRVHQQAIAKRHFLMDKPNIDSRFSKYATDTENLELTPAEFTASLENERQAFLEETLEKFGQNPNRVDAIHALTNTYVDGLIGDTIVKWDENKKGQTEMLLSGEAQGMMNDPHHGVAAGLDFLKKSYNPLGMSFKDQGTKMRGAVAAAVVVHIEQERFDQADKLLKEATEYNLHNKNKLFSTAAGQVELATLRDRIAKPQETLGKQITNAKQNLNKHVNLFANTITHGDVEHQEEAFNNLFNAIEITPEQLTEAGIAIDNSTATEAFRSLSEATQVLLRSDTISDVQRGALMGIQSQIGSIDESGRFAKAPVGIADDTDYGKFESTINNALSGNLNADLGSLVFITDDGRTVSHTDPEVSKLLKKAEQSRAFTNKQLHPNSAYFNKESKDLRNSVSEIVDGLGKRYDYITDSEYLNEFDNLKMEAAREVWNTSSQLETEKEQIDDFNEKFPKKLRAMTDQMTEEIKDRKRLKSTAADQIKSLNEVQEHQNKGEELSEKEGDGYFWQTKYKYPSLSNDFITDVGSIDPLRLQDQARKDRTAIRESKNAQPLLVAHYLRYGVNDSSEFTEETVTELRNLGLGLADIYVGNPIRNEINSAIMYYAKTNEGETPSVAEENAMVKLRTVAGAHELEDLMMLQTAITLYDTQLESFTN